MVNGTLYCCEDSVRAHIIRIAAAYGKSTLKLVSKAPEFEFGKTNKSKDFTKKFCCGRVPAFENDKVKLFDSNAIAHYVTSEQLRGGSSAEGQAEVLQWQHISEQEVMPPLCTWAYPALSLMQPDKAKTERAKTELRNVLQGLNDFLATRTFLVGERLTLADVAAACNLLLGFQTLFDASYRSQIVNVTRWFETCVRQEEFRQVLGDVKLCEKPTEFDEKKFEAIKKQVPAACAPAHCDAKKQQQEPCKKDKKDEKQAQPKKEEKKKEEKKEEKKPAKAEAMEEDDDTKEKEDKDPFGPLPKGNFKMEDWKRIVTNAKDVGKDAMPYFWQNFEPANYSLWYCEYKFPDELKKVFMTCNLINGFFQRIEKMYKHTYGVMAVWGQDGANTISGVWFWAGTGLAFELSDDWKMDYESFEWKKLDPSSEETKKLVLEYWSRDDNARRHGGKAMNQAKIFR